MAVKNSTQLSTKTHETVRGYEIKRLPLGEYLRALDMMSDAPQTVMGALFPGMEAVDILSVLRKVDKNALSGLMLRAMTVVPGEAVKLLSLLTGVPQEALETDPNIGLDGAMEMLEAFWRLNGIENFIRAARRMAAEVKQLRAKTGSKG